MVKSINRTSRRKKGMGKAATKIVSIPTVIKCNKNVTDKIEM